MTQLLSDADIIKCWNKVTDDDASGIAVGQIDFAHAVEAAVLDRLSKQTPVAWMWQFEHDDGAAFSTKEPTISIRDGVNYVPLYTAPVPSDDVIRDAERYRWLRSQEKPEDFYSGAPCWEVSYQANGLGQVMRNEKLDAALDKAIEERT